MIKAVAHLRPRMSAATGAPEKPKTRFGGFAASVGRHAESLIAFSLIGVCVVVAAAAWLLKVRDDKDSRHAAPAPAAAAAVEQAPAEEAPAGVAWAEELEGEMAEMEQQKLLQQQQQEQEQARRAAERQKQTAAVTPAPAARTKAAPAPVIMAAAQPLAAPAVTRARLDWKSCKQPSYPSSSYERREQGTVVMSFQVDGKGKVTDHRIDQSSGSRILDRTAASAISKCSFAPATAGGKPQTSWTQVRFSWKLDG